MPSAEFAEYNFLKLSYGLCKSYSCLGGGVINNQSLRWLCCFSEICLYLDLETSGQFLSDVCICHHT